MPRACQVDHGPRRSGAPCRARSAGPTAPAPSAAAPGRALRRRPARWRPCRGTGSRRPARRRPGSPARPPPSSVSWPCAKRAPMVCTLPASSPSVGGSVTPPGTSTHGRSCIAASAIIIAGRPLSQVATPMHALARRQRADQPAQHHARRRCDRAGCPSCPVVPCVRPSHGSVQKPANGTQPQRAQLLRRRLHQQADFPVAGVVAQGDGRAVGIADAAGRAEDQELAPAQLGRDSSPCRRPASSRTDRRWALRAAVPRSAADCRRGRRRWSARRAGRDRSRGGRRERKSWMILNLLG